MRICLLLLGRKGLDAYESAIFHETSTFFI